MLGPKKKADATEVPQKPRLNLPLAVIGDGCPTESVNAFHVAELRAMVALGIVATLA